MRHISSIDADLCRASLQIRLCCDGALLCCAVQLSCVSQLCQVSVSVSLMMHLFHLIGDLLWVTGDVSNGISPKLFTCVRESLSPFSTLGYICVLQCGRHNYRNSKSVDCLLVTNPSQTTSNNVLVMLAGSCCDAVCVCVKVCIMTLLIGCCCCWHCVDSSAVAAVCIVPCTLSSIAHCCCLYIT